MKIPDALKTIVGSVAPTLATMLGGPLAGTAVTALAKAFGLAPDATADDITKVAQAGGMTPEIIAKVREADQHHAEVMGQQGIDLEKINKAHEQALAATDAGDRDSARKREVAVKDRTPAFLAVFLMFGFFGVLGYLLAVGKPKEGGDALLVLLGGLNTGFAAVLAYYFGSSASSGRKDAYLYNSTPAGKQ